MNLCVFLDDESRAYAPNPRIPLGRQQPQLPIQCLKGKLLCMHLLGPCFYACPCTRTVLHDTLIVLEIRQNDFRE